MEWRDAEEQSSSIKASGRSRAGEEERKEGKGREEERKKVRVGGVRGGRDAGRQVGWLAGWLADHAAAVGVEPQ